MTILKTEEKNQYVYVYLTDGTSFATMKGGCIDIIYDTNGDKGPNESGRDKFKFLYCPYSTETWISSGKIIPYQPKTMTTRSEALSKCKSTSGSYCTALLFFDNWEFKSDYPHRLAM